MTEKPREAKDAPPPAVPLLPEAPEVPEAADPDPLFTADEAELLVPRREFEPAYAYFSRYAEELAAEVELRFWGFAHIELRENLDNYGVYLLRQDFPVPFLWFGLGWGSDDAPGTLPSWGASLEVNGAQVPSFRRDDGGLRPACEAAAKASSERLGLYVFEKHVELAEWRSFEWLLGQRNQRKALTGFWAGYLDLLSAHGVAEAMDAFIEHNE